MHFRAGFLAVATALALLVTLVPANAADAPAAGCAPSYVVRRGDTLAQIARRFHTSVGELARLNQDQIKNINLIIVGQVLCLPQSAPGGQSKAVIEARYQYTPTIDEAEWSLSARGGFIGMREEFPFQLDNPIDTYSTTEDLSALFSAPPAPLVVGVRNDDVPNGYTLVTVGQEQILNTLHFSGTVPLATECLIPPTAQEALATPDVQSVDVTFALDAASGDVYPFQITQVQALRDVALLKQCFTGSGKEPAFALFPARTGRPGEYRIAILLTQQGFGPPGGQWPRRCASWLRGGRLYRWLRAYYGCG